MIKNLSHLFYDIDIYFLLVYSSDLPLSRQRLESGKSAEYTRRVINFYITKKSCDKFFLYVCTKFGQNLLRNVRQKSKMAATRFSFFLSFQHQTAVISRASSRSPCFILCLFSLLFNQNFIKCCENV